MRSDEFASVRDALRDLSYTEARLLVVDDDRAMVMLLHGLLERVGYRQVRSTTDPREAGALFDDHRPDLVILDLHMPHLDGFGVLNQLRHRIPPSDYVPVLVLTGADTMEAKRHALFRGAKDFLAKPFDPVELLLRLHNLLEARFLHLQLASQNSRLISEAGERAQQLLDAQHDTIERLAQVVEFHDDATGHHTRRVGDLAAQIASRLGMPGGAVELIGRAAPLHDVGKIGIPDAILLKPGRLSPDEFEVVKMHPSIGARILSGGRSEYLSVAEQIAIGHHERWDGMGYPGGLSGDAIPIAARIVAVADFFDAVTHARPYRPAWPLERALEHISSETGRHFDPQVVDAFLDTPTARAGSAPPDGPEPTA